MKNIARRVETKIKNFNVCCDNPNFIEYKIIHQPKPLPLSNVMTECVERLLWYVPNINSKQSSKHELIENPLYDEFTFNFILDKIGMSVADIHWVDSEIDRTTVAFFENKICVNCQKLILQKYRSETKATSLLRHIRNSVAHGRFTVCNDILIGFDMYEKNKYKRGIPTEEVCTGVIKIRPNVLLEALRLLDHGITREKLISHAFTQAGYSVSLVPFNTGIGDLYICKDGRKYTVEIKMIKSRNRFITEQMIYRLLELKQSYVSKNSPKLILMIDDSCLTIKANKILQNSNIIIMDMKNIEKLLSGIDVLERM